MIDKISRGIRNLLNKKPVSTIATILAIKDAAFGLGFILARPEITQTIVYQNIAMLMPAYIFGWLLLIAAVVALVCVLNGRKLFARRGLDFMALFWLFAAFTYAFGGNIILMIVGLVFSLLPGYISFYYKYEGLGIGDKEVRDKHPRPTSP